MASTEIDTRVKGKLVVRYEHNVQGSETVSRIISKKV
jgi:hypothetical protein